MQYGFIRIGVGLNQGSALRPFLFVMVLDRLTDEVRQVSLLAEMLPDITVTCSESRE